MKKMMLMVGILCTFGTMAAETVLFEPAFKDKKEVRFWSPKEIRTSAVSAGGKAVCKMIENKAEKPPIHYFQICIPFTTGLKAGVKYQLSCTLKCNQDAVIRVSVMKDDRPWTAYGYKMLKLKAGVAQDVTLDVSCKKDVAEEKMRVPGLYAGNMSNGGELEISNVKFVSL